MNMGAKQQLEQSMEEEQIRETLNAHWHASAVGDANMEHDIYDDDAICDYPQSGKRILGRSNLQALRSHHPGKPSGFEAKRILGNSDLRLCTRSFGMETSFWISGRWAAAFPTQEELTTLVT
jgi:hypothetical protein